MGRSKDSDHFRIPASVRPEPVTRTGRPSSRASAASTSPCTVGRPGWSCQPA